MTKNIIIVDIDGTISKIGERVKYLQQTPKDWDSFYADTFDDEPIPEMIELVHSLFEAGKRIVFCTGRREIIRDKTELWFEEHINFSVRVSSKILMRKDNDRRSDVEVKPELLKEAGINFDEILFILEDRSCMVAKYRELGLKCLQVAEGNY
jgi:phosphoglycolate phosphatase-like HAD superfamily hydrolase